MTSRTDVIARVLRRPRLKRPVLAHELRQMVQGLGTGTDVEWTATVPQLAEAIDSELTKQEQREQKDTRRGSQPRPGGSTARAELLAVLQESGYNEAAALDLVARAFREPHTDPPDLEFRETRAGGHALLVEYGDCELLGSCQCGRRLGRVTPDKPIDHLAGLWERHTMTELPDPATSIGAS
ncbi:hypothetical protein ACFSUJ_12005 [Streptomyces lusitanus]|uniref:Uncharacterized protein n=1 Tax=Streptomyces lusitanus TaxID=68232 RepID=A0ABU3JP37_9ACTN|nr:hypothetical protein [Streptomyces lusitanus]